MRGGDVGRILAALVAVAALGGSQAAACGRADTVCAIAGGSYRMVLPEREGAQGPVPGVVYLHGWGSSAAAAIGARDRRAEVLVRGMALIVPDGRPRAGRTQRDWGVRDHGTHPRDDLAFLGAVIEDATARGVDPARILLTGFSRGGSMVWDIACRAPGFARAYAPLSGAFWQPMPERCAGGVDLFHTHGWTDKVVPIEGRPVAGGRLVQGDAFASLGLMRATLRCASHRAKAADIEGTLWLKRWDCPGGTLTLMLHPGGHGAPPGWLARILDWFEARLSEPGADAARPACTGAC